MQWLLKLIGFDPIGRIFDTIDHKIDNETDREKAKLKTVEHFVSAQVAVLTGRGWWFPLFFIAPLGFWFTAVCVYSVLWCKNCAFPQQWSIAALPPPLDEYAGIIIGSLFLAKTGEKLIGRLRR